MIMPIEKIFNQKIKKALERREQFLTNEKLINLIMVYSDYLIANDYIVPEELFLSFIYILEHKEIIKVIDWKKINS